MKKYFKQNIVAVLTIPLLSTLFIFANITEVEAANTCPSLAPIMCNNGNCVNDANLCSQGFGSSNIPTSSNSGSTAATNSTNPLSQTCVGNIRYSQADAETCARLAETQGRALGYNVVCSVERRIEYISVNANPVGQQDAFYGKCSINGLDGFDTIDLAGYKGSGNGYTVIDPTNNTQKQMFQAGFVRGQSWHIVPCDLTNQASGINGVTAGVGGSCVNGASNFFGNANPSDWRPKGTQTWGTVKKPGSNTTSTNIKPTTNTGANTSGGSAYNNAILNLITNMINNLRNSGFLNSNNTVNTASADYNGQVLNVIQKMTADAQNLTNTR